MNNTKTQTMDMVVIDRHHGWGAPFPHQENSCGNSVGVVGVAVHQSTIHDRLEQCGQATARQQRSYRIVRQKHAFLAWTTEPPSLPKRCTWFQLRGKWNRGVQDGHHHLPRRESRNGRENFQNQTFAQLGGSSKQESCCLSLLFKRHTRRLPPLLLLNLYCAQLDLPSDVPGADAHRRVFVARCNPCANPRDSDNMTRYLLAGLTQCVPSNFNKKLTPCHISQHDVSAPLHHLESGEEHRPSIGPRSRWGHRGAVRDEKMDLQLSRQQASLYCTSPRHQHHQTNLMCRWMRIGAALWEKSRGNRGALSYTRVRLHAPRGMASSLHHYCASQRGKFLVQSRRRLKRDYFVGKSARVQPPMGRI